MNDTGYEILIPTILTAHGFTIAVAESCTGGLVGDKITNVPGSSGYFLGGIVTYSNQAKVRLLGVRSQTLELHGAVSRETVIEMAAGARRVFNSDFALAVTGIAGPAGGTPAKPVGTIWSGISSVDHTDALHFLLKGDRIQIKEQAAILALKHLYQFITTSIH
jgi:PncC family amidohydrolase